MTPIPVYITDCVGDCMVVAHAAEDMAQLAVFAVIVGLFVMATLLAGILVTTGLRR